MAQKAGDVTIRSIVDTFGQTARSLLKEQSFAYLVENWSADSEVLTRSPASEYHWLAGLPSEVRVSVYRVREMLGLLESVCADAVSRVRSHSARERLAPAARVLFHQLAQVMRPSPIPVMVDEGCTEEQVSRARTQGFPKVVEIEKGTRLEALEKYVGGLGAVAEELDEIAVVAPADDGPAAPPAAQEAASLALIVNALEEAKRLTEEGEGPYVALVEALPLARVKGFRLKKRLPLPALTPRRLFDWDAPHFTNEHHRLLAEVQALYERLKTKTQSALGVGLTWHWAEGADEAVEPPPNLPGLEARRAGLLVGQLREDFHWLGTILPVGKNLAWAWLGWAAADQLKVFMTEKTQSCFAEVRDVAATLQNGLADLQEDAERRMQAEERILAREAARKRLQARAAGAGRRRRGPARRPERSPARFPTPEGATWEKVRISMRGDSEVLVRVGKKSGRYSYYQMGMADGRNGEPTAQWKLLEAFAKNEGTFDWTDSKAKRKLQKQRELLSKALRRFFGIRDDPFSLTVDGKGWVARFRIRSLS